MKNMKLPALAFLDVETTGLSAMRDDRICEIAVLRIEADGAQTQYQTLVNPLRPLSPGASAINGITDEMVAGAPEFSDVADKINELIRDAVLVCHNAQFDTSFLSMEFSCCGRSLCSRAVVDTLKIARNYFNFPSNSLGRIASYLGIKTEGQHRALADVIMTKKIFDYFCSELLDQGHCTFDELIIPSFPRKLSNAHPSIQY